MSVDHGISSALLQPAEGVQLFLREDEGLLFDQPGQRLFHLNVTAAFLWCHVENVRSIEELVSEMIVLMDVDRDRAYQMVLGIVRTWWALGLVHGSRSEPPAEQQAASIMEHSIGPSVEEAGHGEEWLHRHYRLLDTRFSLSCPRCLEDLLDPVLAHLETPEFPSASFCLTITRSGDEWRVLQGATVLGKCQDLQRLAPLVHGILASLALRHHSYLLALHAGGIAWEDRAMLLVGKSQSGKTVLTGAMLGQGWDYLSDDMILIGRGNFNAQAVPSSLTIKPGGWELLASRFPDQEAPREHVRADGKTVGYLSPPKPRLGFNAPRQVRWVVFPRREPGLPDSVRSLRPLEGLQRLLTHCCGIPAALLPGDIRRMVEASADMSWFEMTLTDLDAAVATLQSIARTDPCDLPRKDVAPVPLSG
jgi:Coenzyme PQQ synthesis protein D (PqqD)